MAGFGVDLGAFISQSKSLISSVCCSSSSSNDSEVGTFQAVLRSSVVVVFTNRTAFFVVSCAAISLGRAVLINQEETSTACSADFLVGVTLGTVKRANLTFFADETISGIANKAFSSPVLILVSATLAVVIVASFTGVFSSFFDLIVGSAGTSG